MRWLVAAAFALLLVPKAWAGPMDWVCAELVHAGGEVNDMSTTGQYAWMNPETGDYWLYNELTDRGNAMWTFNSGADGFRIHEEGHCPLFRGLGRCSSEVIARRLAARHGAASTKSTEHNFGRDWPQKECRA